MVDVTVSIKRTDGAEPGLAVDAVNVSQVLVACPAGTVVKVNGIQVST